MLLTVERIGKNGIQRFTSYAENLSREAFKHFPLVLAELGISLDEIDISFTHASSKKD